MIELKKGLIIFHNRKLINRATGIDIDIRKKEKR